MITEIKSIIGIGCYNECEPNISLKKNQIIFGFNGTGKSTLSDIFYSITNSKVGILEERKTLPFLDGRAVSEMKVTLNTDNGFLNYSNGSWDSANSVYVFNDRYIDDYLFIENNHDIDNETVVFGKIETQLSKKKHQLQQDLETDLSKINTIINARKELCGNLGLGKTKLNITGWEKRVNKIANIKLYSSKQRQVINSALQKLTAYDERIQILNNWYNSLSCGIRYLETENLCDVKHVKKVLLETPTITNKEISEHISKYMSHTDVNWLSMGAKYQADATICPFCGQKITNDDYQKLTIQLSKFIKSRQKQKADNITKKIKRIQYFFDIVKLEEIFHSLQLIESQNNEFNLLHKNTINLIKSLQLDPIITDDIFSSISAKLSEKVINPYEIVIVSNQEEKACNLVATLFGKWAKLIKLLENEIQSLEKKVTKTKEYTKSKSLYEASFGEAHESIIELISLAKNVEELHKKICNCQTEIDDLFETKKLDIINEFLKELNVNFRVQLLDKKYHVQILGYKATEYNKNNKILCSEGERRMLALAYFLEEISNCSAEKVVVVDDPISSLDLSRKSVVAFKISDLMKEPNNQIIVLSHDISFVEKIISVIPTNTDIGLLELSKNKQIPFKHLILEDYLLTDENVYEKMIRNGESSNKLEHKLIALMALRPYTFIKIGMDTNNNDFIEIEKRSTHLSHSIYAQSSRAPYNAKKYSKRSLRAYCKKVAKITKTKIDFEKLVPDDWEFNGFNFETAWRLYASITGDTITSLRMKALVFRLVLETSLYMLVNKKRFNPERIGSEYNNALKGTTGQKRQICAELDKLYDLSKKYHHGADSGSTLGLSALNPYEMLYFDDQITNIHNWIVENIITCNPNATLYK